MKNEITAQKIKEEEKNIKTQIEQRQKEIAKHKEEQFKKGDVISYIISSERLKKKSWPDIPDRVNKFINRVINCKCDGLTTNQFGYNFYLPKSLQIEHLKKTIFKINTKITTISKKNNFSREHSAFETIESDKSILFRLCRNTFIESEYNEYLNFNLGEKDFFTASGQYLFKDSGLEMDRDKIDFVLPKFELVTDYLALLEYYNELVEDFKKVEEGGELTNPKTKNQLQTKLTDDHQRGKLFELLVSNGFIPDNDKDGFIWAFGGVDDNCTTYSTEWLKKDNLAVYLVDCLCFDKTVKIQDSYLNRAGKIFGIMNPRQTKKGYENNKKGTPDGYELIDTIILEAQK